MHSSTLAWKIPRTSAYQAPLSMGFSRQEYWSALPLPSPDMLSRLVITFLPRSKHLNFMTVIAIAMILEPPKIKSDTVSTVSPSVSMKWWDRMPWSSFSECWALSRLFHSIKEKQSIRKCLEQSEQVVMRPWSSTVMKLIYQGDKTGICQPADANKKQFKKCKEVELSRLRSLWLLSGFRFEWLQRW